MTAHASKWFTTMCVRSCLYVPCTALNPAAVSVSPDLDRAARVSPYPLPHSGLQQSGFGTEGSSSAPTDVGAKIIDQAVAWDLGSHVRRTSHMLPSSMDVS